MRLTSSHCRLKSVIFQCCILFIALECFIVNTIILFFIWNAGATLMSIANAPGSDFFGKLASSPTFFGELFQSGKQGGFVSILQHTLDRVYIERADCSVLGQLGVDVSGAGETLYVYKRLQKWESNKKWARLVVDIGANDGFLTSNSHNFIRWGWRAVLVEPQATQLQLARDNLRG